MPPGFNRQLELGAHPVRPGHEHRLPVIERGHIKQRAKAAQVAQNPRSVGGLCDVLQAFHQQIAAPNIHPGIPVAQFFMDRIHRRIIAPPPACFNP